MPKSEKAVGIVGKRSVVRVSGIGLLVLIFFSLVSGICYTQTDREFLEKGRELLEKGMEYGVVGEFQKARKQFQDAVEVNPFDTFLEIYLRLSEAAVEKEIKTETALYLFKGLRYVYEGIYDEAITEFNKALEINPYYGETRYNLGLAYLDKGMYDRAITEFNKALEINPSLVVAHMDLALAYFYKEQYSLAIMHCDIAIDLGAKVHPEFLEALEPHRED